MNSDASIQLESQQPLDGDDLLPSLAQQVRVQRLNVARWILFVLAMIMIGAGFIFFSFADSIARANLDRELKQEIGGRQNVDPQWLKDTEERAARAMHVVGGLGVGIGLVYGWLGYLVRRHPLPCTLVAFAMFLTGNAFLIVNADKPEDLVCGAWIYEIAVLIALGKSIHVAISFESERRRAERRKRRRQRARLAAPEIARELPSREEKSEVEDFDRPARPAYNNEEGPINCQTCGKLIVVGERSCLFCGASSRPHSEHDVATRHDDAQSIKAVLWSFALLMGLSIIYGWYLHFGDGMPKGDPQQVEREHLNQMLVFDFISMGLVLIAWCWSRRPPPIQREVRTRLAAWLLGPFVLALVLGINVGYAWLLQEYIGRQPRPEAFDVNFKSNFWLVLLTLCIHPAVIEELFFRYLALGHLRRLMSDHAAVWVSAVMFGLAHLYNPLGMPVLILCGVALGYMRVMSGGLLLPMLMHGWHNAIVTMMEP